MSTSEPFAATVDGSSFAYVVGVDIGNQTCSFCTLKPDRTLMTKPTEFANAGTGFEELQVLSSLIVTDILWHNRHHDLGDHQS